MTEEKLELLAKIVLDDNERIDILAQLLADTIEISAASESPPNARLNILVSTAEQLSASHAERALKRAELKTFFGLV